MLFKGTNLNNSPTMLEERDLSAMNTAHKAAECHNKASQIFVSGSAHPHFLQQVVALILADSFGLMS